MAQDELESLPYILCPEVEGVRVSPLWFRPKGGDECPVVYLQDVPVGFHTVLEAQGFVKRPEGWFVDARGRDERFWKMIFGEISFVQRKPISIFNPSRIIFAPAPPSVKVVLNHYTIEHIEYLTKGCNLYGREAYKTAQSDALRGAVTCRGAWPIIKAACVDRLQRSPEDVITFEYAWGTAKKHNLDTRGLPDHISSTLLLEKVKERCRITAQMEKVLPAYYQGRGPAGSLIWADWSGRALYVGAKSGGPINIRAFDEVDIVAQTLLDGGFTPIDNETVLQSWQARVIQLREEQEDNDWTDRLDVPDFLEEQIDDEPAPEPKPASSPAPPPNLSTIHDMESAKTLEWGSVLRRIQELYAQAERRTPYSRVLSREVLSQLLTQSGASIAHPAYLSNIARLLDMFSAVINRESLDKLYERQETVIQELVHALCGPRQGRFQVMRILMSARAADEYIETQLVESAGELVGWWWSGYTCSQVPGSRGWRIFKVLADGSTASTDMGEYPGVREASRALYEQSKHRRMQVFREGLKAGDWYVGYATTTGHILRLSESYSAHEHALGALEQRADTIFDEYVPPWLWEAESEPLSVLKAYENDLTSLGWDGLDIDLSMEEVGGLIEMRQNGMRFASLAPGSVLLGWAEALYRYALAQAPEQVSALIGPLRGVWRRPDLDITLEDDLLEDLGDMQSEIVAVLGGAALQTMKSGITRPDPEAETAIRDYYAALLAAKADAPVSACVRDILLMSAQHAPYRKLSDAYKSAQRLGLEPDVTLFQYAVAGYAWHKARWKGGFDPRIIGAGIPGDCVSGELIPEGATLWQFSADFEGLVEVLAGIRENERTHEVQAR